MLRALLAVLALPALASAQPFRAPDGPTRSRPSYTGFTMGFEVEGREQYWRQIPQIDPYDRRGYSWWGKVLDEAAYAGVDFVAPVTRGCNFCGGNPLRSSTVNPGNSCPLELSALVTARHQSKAEKTPKIALFVDTGGAYTAIKNYCKRGDFAGPKFDFADADGTGEGGWKYFWDYDIKPFFDTVPADDRFLIEGRPLIFFWSVAEEWYTGHKGNTSRFLEWIRANMKAEYGLDPYFVLDQTFPQLDATVTPAIAQGVNDWFDPVKSACTVRAWGGKNFAVSVPGFVDPPWAEHPRNLPRNHGKTLGDCLTRIRDAGATVTLLEGLTDVAESAGYYRSDDPDWDYPEQYLDLVRKSMDAGKAVPRPPRTEAIRAPSVDWGAVGRQADGLGR